MKLYIIIAVVFTVAEAQKRAPPVAILKQIDKHNEDGSYSYGYEAADGSFKIETKYPDGEVYGKYGYFDDTGTLREVEYGASRRGFEPSGNEIQVPPPTLNVNSNAIARPLSPNEEDDGQYREDPGAYYKNEPDYQPALKSYQQPSPSRYQPEYDPEPEFDTFPSYSRQSSYSPEPAYSRPEPVYRAQPSYRPEPAYRPEPSYRPQSSYKPEPSYRSQSSYRPQPSYTPQSYYQPQPQPPPQPSYRPQSHFGFGSSINNDNNNYNPSPYNSNYGPSFQGHPAQNVDINTGSYSVNYKR